MTYALDSSRVISWSAGSDQWNSGSLPTYTEYNTSWQSGLTEGDGTTNNATVIQNALNAASSQQAVTMPAGIYYVNGTITVPSNKVLRGAKRPVTNWLPIADATATTLKLGASGCILIGGSGKPTMGTEVSISSGYTKGSQALVMSTTSHGFSVGDWLSVFEDTDSAIVIDSDGAFHDPLTGCTWCGEDSGTNLIQQFVQVTSVDGATIGISRPLYHTYTAGENPGAKKVTWSTSYAGVEWLRLNGFADLSNAMIRFYGTLRCWVKGVETYNCGSGAKNGHVRTHWSHNNEYRDCYCHSGRNHNSDRNYGIFFFYWNSDHKVENNILRCHRHSLCFEGGGAGCAVLYNYIDDNWEGEDPTMLGFALTTHGPQPMFNLWEGNIASNIQADDTFGGSSHITFFRNHLRGEETDGSDRTGAASWGFYALDVWGPNHYYNAVGNVLGMPAWTGGGGIVRTTSSASCTSVNNEDRVAYYVGCQDSGDYGSAYDPDCAGTLICHGNFDYITNGVAYWEGGADHDLPNSLYYASKPTFLGNLTWPPIGPDVGGYTTDNAALYVWKTGATPPSDGGPPQGTLILSVR